MISLLLISPLASCITNAILPKKYIRETTLALSLLPFFISLSLLLIHCNQSITPMSYFIMGEWEFGVDAISVWFILLTSLLFPITILLIWRHESFTNIAFILSLIYSILILFFTTLNLFFFFLFYESLLVPMFFLIGTYGSRLRRIGAAYKFFLYTFIGSFFMLVALIYIFYTKATLNLEVLYRSSFTPNEEIFLWFAFFASFCVKVPVVPFHVWLPEAHVEAPTIGSVILAGILLKLGIYGFIRISLPLFPLATVYYLPLIYTIAIISIIYSSLVTLRQIDLKKIIAYSSIGHMNFVLLGLFSFSLQGFLGALTVVLSHGLISPALFICVGLLYDRHHTRILYYYRGLAVVMPLFSFMFFFFSLANLGFPGTFSFVGEFLILSSIWSFNPFIALLSSSSLFLSTLYSLWLLNRIVFGSLTPYLSSFNDLSFREFSMLFLLLFLILLFGFLPSLFFFPSSSFSLISNLALSTITQTNI